MIFEDDELDKGLAKWLWQRSTTNDCKIGTQKGYVPVVGPWHNHPGSVSSHWAWSKTQICRWNCHPICRSSSGITISGFGGHIAISSCLLMFVVTCWHFLRARPGRNCSDICHTIGDISTSGWMVTLLFPVARHGTFICEHFIWVWRGRKLLIALELQ